MNPISAGASYMNPVTNPNQGRSSEETEETKYSYDRYGGVYRRIERLDKEWEPSIESGSTSSLDHWWVRQDWSRARIANAFLEPKLPSFLQKKEEEGKKEKEKEVRRRKILGLVRVISNWKRGPNVFPPGQHQSKSLEQKKDEVELPEEVKPHEWKAYGYYSRPLINKVRVVNSPLYGQSPLPAPPHIHEVVTSLRDPDATFITGKHPERWIKGVLHPSLPPRPPRWPVPVFGEPQPFPFECQLNPFLRHPQYGIPPVCWEMAHDTPAAMYGEPRYALPLMAPDFMQPATYPFVTHFYINAVADDTATRWLWPCMIANLKGVRCIDIFTTLYKNFQEEVLYHEYDTWTSIRKRHANEMLTFRDPSPNAFMRRIDYLGKRTMFRGFEPHDNHEGWVLFIGLA